MNNTYALHGFLGLPSDWQDYPHLTPINLWENEILPYWTWAKKFNKSHSGNLVGYSMGGRLALHALIENPSQWESAVIISAHPGLSDVRQRIVEDEQWAKRFESDPWDELMQQWNSNAVFAYDTPIQRNVADYDQLKLAQALRVWSLGQQENLRERIRQLPLPILWVVGEKDTKYVEISKTLRFSNPNSRIVVVPNSGHRVPWHEPSQFKRLIEEWTHDCNSCQTLDAYRTV